MLLSCLVGHPVPKTSSKLLKWIILYKWWNPKQFSFLIKKYINHSGNIFHRENFGALGLKADRYKKRRKLFPALKDTLLYSDMKHGTMEPLYIFQNFDIMREIYGIKIIKNFK